MTFHSNTLGAVARPTRSAVARRVAMEAAYRAHPSALTFVNYREAVYRETPTFANRTLWQRAAAASRAQTGAARAAQARGVAAARARETTAPVVLRSGARVARLPELRMLTPIASSSTSSPARDNAFSILVATATSAPEPVRSAAARSLAHIAASAPSTVVRNEASRQLARISGRAASGLVTSTAMTPGRVAFVQASRSRGMTLQQAEYAWANSDATFHAAWEAKVASGRLSGLGAVLAVM